MKGCDHITTPSRYLFLASTTPIGRSSTLVILYPNYPRFPFPSLPPSLSLDIATGNLWSLKTPWDFHHSYSVLHLCSSSDKGPAHSSLEGVIMHPLYASNPLKIAILAIQILTEGNLISAMAVRPLIESTYLNSNASYSILNLRVWDWISARIWDSVMCGGILVMEMHLVKLFLMALAVSLSMFRKPESREGIRLASEGKRSLCQKTPPWSVT